MCGIKACPCLNEVDGLSFLCPSCRERAMDLNRTPTFFMKKESRPKDLAEDFKRMMEASEKAQLIQNSTSQIDETINESTFLESMPPGQSTQVNVHKEGEVSVQGEKDKENKISVLSTTYASVVSGNTMVNTNIKVKKWFEESDAEIAKTYG